MASSRGLTAIVGHNTVPTPTKGKLSVDPLTARNTRRSPTSDIGPSYFLVILVPDSHHQSSSKTSPDESVAYCSFAVRPPQSRDAVCDGRLDALALCLLEGLGVRHEMVCALSALEANDPQEKFMVRRS